MGDTTQQTETAEAVATADATQAPANLPEPTAAAAELHPAHSVLDEIDDKLNRLGSYAVTELRNLLDKVRSLL